MTREIRLPAPHPRLRPRLEGEARRPGHPGTAVRIGEDLYEVVAAERSGPEWVYRLEPWPGQETLRVLIDWDEGAERRFLADLRTERIRERKNLLAWAAQAFLGFLPARLQERRYEATGWDPARATLWSAVLEMIVATPFAFIFFISRFVGGAGGLGRSVPAWAGALAAVALGEGVFRLASVLSTGEPVGSLFLALLDLRKRPAARDEVPGDEISAIEGTLKVVSPVPKVWWERAGGVTYGGEPYILAGGGREGTKHVYAFRRGGAGFPVLDPELEKARNRSSDMSHVFAPLWGFLPPELQKAIEFYGRYTPRPYVTISIGFNVLLALAIVGPGLKNLTRGLLGPWSLLLSVASVYLFTESVLRLIRLYGSGEISGSVLGVLIKPLYARIIEQGPREEGSEARDSRKVGS